MKTSRDINPNNYKDLVTDLERLQFLVKLASLAPSSHNTQPWFFRIQKNQIFIVPDFSKRLPIADPDGREFAITLGTVVSSLAISAESYGLDFEYVVNPDYKPDTHVAVFTFNQLRPQKVDLKKLIALINRHNSRLAFEKTVLDKQFIDKLSLLLEPGINLTMVSDEKNKSVIKPIVLESIEEAFANKDFRKELYPWLKISLGKHEDGLVGRNLGLPFLASLIFPTLTRFYDISAMQVRVHSMMMKNVPMFGILRSNEDSPVSWIKVGQSLHRIQVESENSQVSIGIMQGGIESKRHRLRIKEVLGLSDLPQMFFRLGYTSKTHYHSPRRPLKKIILKDE